MAVVDGSRTAVVTGELFSSGQAVGSSANSLWVSFAARGRSKATFHIYAADADGGVVAYTEMLSVANNFPKFMRAEYNHSAPEVTIKGSNTGTDLSWTTLVSGATITLGAATHLFVNVSTV